MVVSAQLLRACTHQQAGGRKSSCCRALLWLVREWHTSNLPAKPLGLKSTLNSARYPPGSVSVRTTRSFFVFFCSVSCTDLEGCCLALPACVQLTKLLPLNTICHVALTLCCCAQGVYGPQPHTCH
jgi:hypothetical protein